MKTRHILAFSKEKILVILIAILFLFSFVIILFNKKPSFKNKVAVTIFPFYDITKEIVGNKFEVVLIIPPGSEPHNFEITPKDIANITESKIILTSGTYLDSWVKNIVSYLGEIKIVKLNQNLPLIIENNGEIDPHFWLSLENMKKIAENITKEIIKIDHQNQNYYLENLDSLKNKIDTLKTKSSEELKNINSRYFITQHNAFQYLAKELNFQVFYLESTNKEITPDKIKNLIEKIKIYKIKSIFQEPNEISPGLKNIAQDLNLKIFELDPLEGKGALNFFEGYENNIKILKEALP